VVTYSGQVPDDLVPVREVLPVFFNPVESLLLIGGCHNNYLINILDLILIHRKVAKCAEKSQFMFVVERTAYIKGNPFQMKMIFKKD